MGDVAILAVRFDESLTVYEAFLVEEGESSARSAEVGFGGFAVAEELRYVFDAKAEILSQKFERSSFLLEIAEMLGDCSDVSSSSG